MDPVLFAEHNYGLYSLQLQLSGGKLSLQTSSEYENFNIKKTATSIKEEKLEERIFEVDTSKILSPSLSMFEKKPGPTGGLEVLYKYLAKTVRHPHVARRLGVEGRVLFRLHIDEQGNLSNLKLIKGIGTGCDEEAEQVLRTFEGKWEPGVLNGQKINGYLVL